MDINSVKDVKTTNKSSARLVRLSEVKTMTDKALIKTEIRKKSRMAEMAKMTIIDAMEVCAAESLNAFVQATATITIPTLIENVLNQKAVDDYM